MSNNKKPPTLLVDGSSYLYRAFHAMPELITSKNQQTGTVRGVINMIRKLIKDYPSSPMAVVFDAKGKTFRNDLFPEYKAHRPPMPDLLREQIAPIHEIIEAMGLPLIIIPNVEADDVLGTFAKQATEEGIDVIISTGDKDLAQLVNSQVSLINTMTNTLMDTSGVVEKFGIGPQLVVDYLALMGDKVDNIPGIAGVGEKTALGLLQGLGGLDVIYEHLDQVSTLGFRGAKTLAKKLIAEKESAYLSYELATIKTDVEMDWHINDVVLPSPDNERLFGLFEALEFKSWLSDVKTDNSTLVDNDAGGVGEGAETPDTKRIVDYQIVLTEAQLDKWILRLENAELFAVDTETTSLKYMEARVVGISICVEVGQAAYIPFGHDYIGAPKQLSQDLVLGRLKPILEDPKRNKVGQNLKYDRNVLLNHGISLEGIVFDTMLESYVLNSTATRHDMDSLALKYLDLKTIHFEDVAGKGAKQLSFNQISLDKAGPYAAEDAEITLLLHQALWQKLSQDEPLKLVLTSIEIPLIKVISQLERNGTLVDGQMLLRQSDEIAKRLLEIEQQAYELAGQEFNLASPKQLQEILFEKLQLPVIKKTPKGQPSTAEPILQELALDYPLPKVLLEYRGLSKLKSTYTDSLPLQINSQTGRIHTSYHQAVTATGRLSSTNPNLQNIPIKSEEGRRVRQAFIAPEGFKIMAADYSQIELRIMAHLSQDKGLLSAFAEGLDVHKATASEVFGVGITEVSASQRRSAKAINFGLIYGMSAFGLARQLAVTRHDAQQYMDMYFERYPGVKAYMEETKVTAAAQGYVETLFGRRLYLPEINASNAMRRQAAERTAINAPMQGSAADIIKKAMIRVNDWLLGGTTNTTMILQVHDELVFEVANDEIDEVTTKVCTLMSKAVELDVPLLVEAGFGDNWDEAH